MFDIGWTEMVVVIVVMIIVIGPKDLPRVLHTMGQWVARARAVARNFQDSIEQMAQEAGLDEVKKSAEQIRDFSLEDEVEKSIDPDGTIKEGMTIEGPKGEPASDAPAATDEPEASDEHEPARGPKP